LEPALPRVLLRVVRLDGEALLRLQVRVERQPGGAGAVLDDLGALVRGVVGGDEAAEVDDAVAERDVVALPVDDRARADADLGAPLAARDLEAADDPEAVQVQ